MEIVLCEYSIAITAPIALTPKETIKNVLKKFKVIGFYQTHEALIHHLGFFKLHLLNHQGFAETNPSEQHYLNLQFQNMAHNTVKHKKGDESSIWSRPEYILTI